MFLCYPWLEYSGCILKRELIDWDVEFEGSNNAHSSVVSLPLFWPVHPSIIYEDTCCPVKEYTGSGHKWREVGSEIDWLNSLWMHSTLIKYNTEQFPLNTPAHIIYLIFIMFLPGILFTLQMMEGSAGEIRSNSYHISLFPEYIKMTLSSSSHDFSKLSAASLLSRVTRQLHC